MNLFDAFKTGAARESAARGKISSFYSDEVQDKSRRGKIKSIAIPQEIQSLTTGEMPYMTDGSLPLTTVRYDACRDQETGRWDIREFLKIGADEGTTLPVGLKDGQQDDIYTGSPSCDFDAIRFLSEESAKRDHLIRQNTSLFSSPYKGYRDLPHWRNVAEKARQPVDKNGHVQPVVAGQVLADHVIFDDPKQIEIRDSSRPPAVKPVPRKAEPVTQGYTPPRETPTHGSDPDPMSNVVVINGLSVAIISGATMIFALAALGLISDGANQTQTTSYKEVATQTQPKSQQEARPKYLRIMDEDMIQAASNEDTATVMRLIEKGADVNTKNNYGETALDIAERSGNKNMASMLSEMMADAAQAKKAAMPVKSQPVPGMAR